jgi:hypothetical protein
MDKGVSNPVIGKLLMDGTLVDAGYELYLSDATSVSPCRGTDSSDQI